MKYNTGRRKPQKDNYAEFLSRLDAASASLTTRRDSLNIPFGIVTLLLNNNRTGLQFWEQRLARVGELLNRHAGGAEEFSNLTELHGVALRMEPLFRNRTERIGEKLAGLGERRDEIDKALLRLEKSRVKLNSSQMVAQERENLSRAVADLGGPLEGSAAAIPDLGLADDLRQAREAVILAEALIEAKGS